VITAAHRIIGAATRLLRPTDVDADTGPVDPVDIAAAPHGGSAPQCEGPAPHRSDPQAPPASGSVHDEARGTVDSPMQSQFTLKK
jgi:hypothetical protein